MKQPIERVNVIMERLGFNDNSSEGAQAAFIKNLIKQAYGVNVEVPPQYKETRPQTFAEYTTAVLNKKAEPAQLSFDFDQDDSKKVG